MRRADLFYFRKSARPSRIERDVRRMAQARKKSAQIAPALKAARIKARSKQKPNRPAKGRPPRPESAAASAGPIAASPHRARAPPHRHHLDKRAAEIASQIGDDDDLLDTRQVADLLGMSTQWVEIARHKGIGPPY